MLSPTTCRFSRPLDFSNDVGGGKRHQKHNSTFLKKKKKIHHEAERNELDIQRLVIQQVLKGFFFFVKCVK